MNNFSIFISTEYVFMKEDSNLSLFTYFIGDCRLIYDVVNEKFSSDIIPRSVLNFQ